MKPEGKQRVPSLLKVQQDYVCKAHPEDLVLLLDHYPKRRTPPLPGCFPQTLATLLCGGTYSCRNVAGISPGAHRLASAFLRLPGEVVGFFWLFKVLFLF